MAAAPDSHSTRFRVVRLVHAALVVSLVVYAAIVQTLDAAAGWQPPVTGDAARMLRWLVAAAAAALALAILTLRGRRLSPASVEAVARREGADAALRRLQTRVVVLLALAESIGVYGLALFLVAGSLREFYGLWAAGLVCLLLLTPRRAPWEAVGRASNSRSGAVAATPTARRPA